MFGVYRFCCATLLRGILLVVMVMIRIDFFISQQYATKQPKFDKKYKPAPKCSRPCPNSGINSSSSNNDVILYHKEPLTK